MISGALFSPSSIAIIGASATAAGHAGRTLANLQASGFPGAIYPVNPKYDQLHGLSCYPHIAAIEATPDVAYVMLPASRAVDAVRDCGKAGVRLAIVCSSGFAELGSSGSSLQSELAAIAAESGIRVLGPNCIGVVSPSGSVTGAPTFNLTLDQVPGGTVLLSHSGGIGVTAFNRAQAAGVGVHSLVSLGNEADLTMAAVLESLLDEPSVHTIGLIVEQIREPQRFLRAARAAATMGKQLVALKTGRSQAGSAAAAGHTGALAGSSRVFSALMRETGVLEAASLDQLVDTIHLLAASGGAALGNRIGVVSPSGGEAAYVADQAEGYGFTLPPLDTALQAEMQTWIPLGTPRNPLDLTGQIIGDSELLTKVLAGFGAQDDIDLLLVCLATWGGYDADAILAQVIESARASAVPVIFSAWDAGALTSRVVELLKTSGMPWFPSPDRALASLELATQPLEVAQELDDTSFRKLPPPEGITEQMLAGHAAMAVLRSGGLPVADEETVSSPQAAVEVASRWDAEVVLKLNAPSVVHKTELGLVELDLRTRESVLSAGERLIAQGEQLGLVHGGLIVARREKGIELLVGGVCDEQFGRCVLVGAGGILTEHFADTVLLSAPADATRVLAALKRLTVWPILIGARGASYDVDSLVDFVTEFSRAFAGTSWMTGADLNPVVVRGAATGGVVAVDAVIACSSGAQHEEDS